MFIIAMSNYKFHDNSGAPAAADALLGRRARIALTALAVIAGAFLGAAAWRGATFSGDLAVLYAGGRAWLAGENPYDYATLARIFDDKGCKPMMLPQRFGLPAVYPPPIFVLLTPVAAAPWPVARVMWLVINLAALAAVVWWAAKYRRRGSGPKLLNIATGPVILFATILICLWPTFSNFKNGQLSLAAVALTAWAAMLAENKRTVAAGLLAGLACVVKPHVGIMAVIYLLVRGRWKSLGWAAIVVLMLTIAAVARLRSHGVDWRGDLARNIQDYSFGGVGDPTSANVNRDQLINLHYPLHAFIADRPTVNTIVWGVALGSIGATLWAFRRGRANAGLVLAVLATVLLMAFTHRIYDGVLLVFPLAWAVRRLTDVNDPPPAGARGRVWAWAAIVLVALFIIPGAAILASLAGNGRIAAGVITQWWWHGLAMSHQCWLLLMLLLALVLAAWTARPTAQ